MRRTARTASVVAPSVPGVSAGAGGVAQLDHVGDVRSSMGFGRVDLGIAREPVGRLAGELGERGDPGQPVRPGAGRCSGDAVVTGPGDVDGGEVDHPAEALGEVRQVVALRGRVGDAGGPAPGTDAAQLVCRTARRSRTAPPRRAPRVSARAPICSSRSGVAERHVRRDGQLSSSPSGHDRDPLGDRPAARRRRGRRPPPDLHLAVDHRCAPGTRRWRTRSRSRRRPTGRSPGRRAGDAERREELPGR